MSITLEQAKALRPGDILIDARDILIDARGKRWKVNGKVQTWKTRPNEVKVPVKHGLYTYDYITHDDLDKMTMER